MVLDLKWLKKNQKSRKSNLERRLVRQGIFVEYLEKVKVYSSDIRAPRYKVRFSKALRALPEAIFTAHWDHCNKILEMDSSFPENEFNKYCTYCNGIALLRLEPVSEVVELTLYTDVHHLSGYPGLSLVRQKTKK